MTTLIESIRKGPLMTMTLECETEFPKALKNIMASMGLEGEAVYKGYPVMDEGQEYWWVELHIYTNKDDDHKKTGHWMFTNPELHTSFFESSKCAAWCAIVELGERLKWRMHNTQENLKEEKKYAQELEVTTNQLREDVIDMALELCDRDDMIAAKDTLIASLMH